MARRYNMIVDDALLKPCRVSPFPIMAFQAEPDRQVCRAGAKPEASEGAAQNSTSAGCGLFWKQIDEMTNSQANIFELTTDDCIDSAAAL
jgi:hypothetical protein